MVLKPFWGILPVVLLNFALVGAGRGAENSADVSADVAAGRVVMPTVVLKQGTYLELKGALEYVLVAKGGKEYESLFTTPCSAVDIHAALEKLKLLGGQPATEDTLPKGPRLRIFAEYTLDGKSVRRPVDEFLAEIKTGQPLKPVEWVYTGSAPAKDPVTGKSILQASLTHSIIGLHPSDASPLLQNPRPESVKENLYKANVKALPPEGTAVRLILERSKLPKDTRRMHVFITGRVQGVGFRAFTQHQAGLLKVKGFVKNLADGRVEAVVEGPEARVKELLTDLKRGPRAARVQDLKISDEPPQGDYDTFEIQY
jgi:acylphosphatase